MPTCKAGDTQTSLAGLTHRRASCHPARLPRPAAPATKICTLTKVPIRAPRAQSYGATSCLSLQQQDPAHPWLRSIGLLSPAGTTADRGHFAVIVCHRAALCQLLGTLFSPTSPVPRLRHPPANGAPVNRAACHEGASTPPQGTRIPLARHQSFGQLPRHAQTVCCCLTRATLLRSVVLRLCGPLWALIRSVEPGPFQPSRD